jgi:hypothetical protein
MLIPVEGNLCRVKNVTGALPKDTAEEGPTGNCQDSVNPWTTQLLWALKANEKFMALPTDKGNVTVALGTSAITG